MTKRDSQTVHRIECELNVQLVAERTGTAGYWYIRAPGYYEGEWKSPLPYRQLKAALIEKID